VQLFAELANERGGCLQRTGSRRHFGSLFNHIKPWQAYLIAFISNWLILSFYDDDLNQAVG